MVPEDERALVAADLEETLWARSMRRGRGSTSARCSISPGKRTRGVPIRVRITEVAACTAARIEKILRGRTW